MRDYPTENSVAMLLLVDPVHNKRLQYILE